MHDAVLDVTKFLKRTHNFPLQQRQQGSLNHLYVKMKDGLGYQELVHSMYRLEKAVSLPWLIALCGGVVELL